MTKEQITEATDREYNQETILLSDLPKGTIFCWRNFVGEGMCRLHSIKKISKKHWMIFMFGINYQGDIEKVKWTSFTSRDTIPKVFVPKFYLCEFKKSYGIPCIPVSNHRIFLPNNLNELNMSDKYCSHNNYWYKYVNEYV
jgi:hypothetical protein